jgi:hypothetical protein
MVVDQAPTGFGTEPGKYHSDAIFLIGISSDEAIKIFNPREGVDKVWLSSPLRMTPILGWFACSPVAGFQRS